MSIQDTINTTVNAINSIVNLVEATILATASGIAYMVTNFPQVLRNSGKLFKFGLDLGFEIGKLCYNALHYIGTHLPEIAEFVFYTLPKFFLYDVPKAIFEFFHENFAETFKFMFYTVPKFFLYDVPKVTAEFLYHNLPEISYWLARKSLEIVAHTVGIVLGIAYAPFKIGYDAINGRSAAPGQPAHRMNATQILDAYSFDQEPNSYLPSQHRAHSDQNSSVATLAAIAATIAVAAAVGTVYSARKNRG